MSTVTDGDLREWHPDEGESLVAWSRRLWADVPPDKRARCAEHLRTVMGPARLREWREEIHKDPYDYMTPHHFYAGMAIRNALRDVAFDSELPSGCWDDYYTAALEDAVFEEFER